MVNKNKKYKKNLPGVLLVFVIFAILMIFRISGRAKAGFAAFFFIIGIFILISILYSLKKGVIRYGNDLSWQEVKIKSSKGIQTLIVQIIMGLILIGLGIFILLN